jgi:hypothetical protein
MEAWLAAAKIDSGAVFRAIGKGGRVLTKLTKLDFPYFVPAE